MSCKLVLKIKLSFRLQEGEKCHNPGYKHPD